MAKLDFSNEGIILVLGVTGAGKSYFLNKLGAHGVKEGHGLESETAECQAVQILLDDEEKRSITVVDTPGFDDTNRPQGEILADIAEFLGTQHALGVPLRGVLYLHKITDNKMTGSSLTYLNLLRSLVGEDALENVVLVTSMWNKLRDEDRSEALRREQELIDKYWGPMQEKGSYVAQFDGTTDSAFSLVYQLAGNENVVLDVQRQIMDQNKSILGTSAGEDLAQKLEKDIKDYRAKVAQLEAELQEELKEQPRNREQIRMLQEDKAQMEELLQLAEKSMERMKVRPSSSIKQRLKQALKERGRDAAFVLATALHLTLTVVQLSLGG
ncbi:hypothetical protein CEP54_012460 [Fusarium duplospermum]|uniref:AIG1-type G domain-containing protein n=1 Tax=Fusarium duplospermum TaxID=1325734 RepID=A0A428P8R9_9HYPO|nr:hypothetical protein CEP54_012460 [Fusarium duplospermum]